MILAYLLGLVYRIKALFRRKPKVIEEKPPQEAEKAPPEGDSIDEKQ